MCTPDPPASLADATGGLAGAVLLPEQEPEDHHPLPGPPRALLACQFGRWWPRYREHALSPAVVIDLTDEEVDFLLQDGVALGDGDAARALARAPSSSDDDDASSSSSSSSSSGSEVADWTSRLPRLAAAIADALASPELAAAPAVVPKLNWSTPWDAAWVLPPAGLLLPPAPEAAGAGAATTVSLSDLVGGGGSVVVCGNAEQVVLLLQSSDRAAHDLSLVARLRGEGGEGGEGGDDDAATTTIKPQLALRSWRPLRPERELRLFVAGHRVVGVSQRDATQRYEQLRAPAAGGGGGGGGGGVERVIDALARRACAFHARHVRDTFEVADYAMDLYVMPDHEEEGGAVRIVDVNPVAATTSAACFGSWRAVPGGLWRSPEYRSYLAEGEDENEEDDDEEEEAEGESEQQQHQQLPPVRFVGDGLGGGASRADGVGVGQRFACGMPFDVLNMSDWAGGVGGGSGGPAGAADVIVEAMRRAAARDDDGGGGEPT